MHIALFGICFNNDVLIIIFRMAGSQCNKLMKASRDASNKNVQHLLAVVKPDGSIAFSGSDNFLRAVISTADVYSSLQTTINANRQEEGTQVSHLEVVTYPYLPCSPYSKSFKGSAMIRKANHNQYV